MTKEQIKNDYAVSEGFNDWGSLVTEHFHDGIYGIDCLISHENELMEIYAIECLKLASENAMIDGNMFSRCGCELDKESITNENNIIKC